MNSVKPTGITANRQRAELTVVWNDSHESIYPFALLRGGCPCAECRGGYDKMSALPDPEVFSLPLQDSPATRLSKIEAVGSYAIAIEWEDGHNYGIYDWNYLWALCPCPICRPLFEED